MNTQKLVVLGGGVLGSQIAYQAAFSGLQTVIYDISEDALKAAQQKIDAFPDQYVHDLNATAAQVDAATENLTLTTDLATAVTGADFIIESVSERMDVKESVYRSLVPYIGANTLLLTNTSTLLPSQLIKLVPNQERFLAMHFANQIWVHNVAELMWAPGTPEAAIQDAEALAKQMHMIPIMIHKEVSGYVMNSIFLPMINAGLLLWADDVTDPVSIDKNWMVSMGVDRGPFGFLDIMGLNTAVNIEKGFYESTKDPRFKSIVEKLQAYVDAGKLGMSTGEGFYKYPNPEYQKATFTQA